MRLLRGVLPLLALTAAATVRAHDFELTDVRLSLKADGSFVADVTCDLDALALGVDSSADSAALAAEIEALEPLARDRLVEGLAALLRRRIRIRADGDPVPFEIAFPERGQPQPAGRLPSALGLVARLTGRLPPGAREVTFFASRAFPPVRLSIQSETGAALEDVLGPGEESRPYPVAGSLHQDAAAAVAHRFTTLGFTHILPQGLDHVLFVVGLTLLTTRPRPLLLQVSAFTLAHTVTLGLSTYGVLRLPPALVEPLIALSIVYVAAENLVTRRLRSSRLLIVFGFGLLHGLGFAGALDALGWPEGRKVLALLAFNVGVELGQLAVIGLALVILVGSSRFGVPRQRLTNGLSLLFGAAGLYWAVERALPGLKGLHVL